ncbi:16S rRNA (cytosine(967)-C(5))-methyltransferase RsmB [Salinicoccus halodurans]|uniref:16S rRNA (cytosine(967)-C(5))-methyltransferase n=1 Tax=Salinicoccus halodurans TaxID=407035 RepID=A0A0F7HKP3_9STAP|nr:16S rRNA (cytosine(967)-C(5))-methyltransferase RsmB [Salinicoccus halodurans]AKG73737.1 16S rRNA methyltransferase [Salinicoccus halodurans]SFK55076.1 16S rRNA (cytosine967-C5)-methyltransferase [Salinicoccus halodurans]
MNVRELALEAYTRITEEGGYSNIVLNDIIKNNEMESADRGLLTEIVYGTISKRLTIDFYIKPYIKKKIRRWQKSLLYLSVYQIVWLERVPNYAVINEAVDIAKDIGGPGHANVINGILRNFERNPLRDIGGVKKDLSRLSIETSIPLWILRQWKTHHGMEGAEKIARALNTHPVMYIRTNTSVISRQELLEKLQMDGHDVEKSALHPDAVKVHGGDILRSALYKEGYFSIQDVSSMLVNTALEPERDDVILDACSAPGGKGLHALEKMTVRHVDLSDIHEHKIPLIKSQAKRLGLENFNAFQGDAAAHDYSRMYDRIIVDAPCSGLGVIRRKPEIRYERTEQDIGPLVELQLDILNHVKNYLKPGGILVYSTCTIHQMENENVAYTFKKQNDDMEFDPFSIDALDFEGPFKQILPHEAGTDGFFIARFRKKEK